MQARLAKHVLPLLCHQVGRIPSSALSLPSGEGLRVGYSREARSGVQDRKQLLQFQPRGGRFRCATGDMGNIMDRQHG
jgi:hypothetical protein